MKLLLDENIPTKLKSHFSDEFQVATVSDMGWQGIKNGDLLKLMQSYEFEGLITTDKSITYQQNLRRFNASIIILNAPNNKIQTLQAYINKLHQEIKKANKERILEINLA